MDKPILEIYVRQTLEGPALMFKWPPNAREMLERANALQIVGEALASFGEQLRMEGLGLTSTKPAALYGPDGRPVV